MESDNSVLRTSLSISFPPTASTENIPNYYTVIAIDKDWERCFIKFIGVYSTYELAKDATIYHDNNFGENAVYNNEYNYKIFSGIIDKNYEIDSEDDLLQKEYQNKYEKENKEKIEIQRKKNEEIYKRMEKEKQEKIERVTKIFHKISCDRDASELTPMEMKHIIGFYDRYTVLATTNNLPNARFVLDSLKSFEVISKLGIKNAQTDNHLSFIMDIYRKRGIKGDL